MSSNQEPENLAPEALLRTPPSYSDLVAQVTALQEDKVKLEKRLSGEIKRADTNQFLLDLNERVDDIKEAHKRGSLESLIGTVADDVFRPILQRDGVAVLVDDGKGKRSVYVDVSPYADLDQHLISGFFEKNKDYKKHKAYLSGKVSEMIRPALEEAIAHKTKHLYSFMNGPAEETKDIELERRPLNKEDKIFSDLTRFLRSELVMDYQNFDVAGEVIGGMCGIRIKGYDKEYVSEDYHLPDSISDIFSKKAGRTNNEVINSMNRSMNIIAEQLDDNIAVRMDGAKLDEFSRSLRGLIDPFTLDGGVEECQMEMLELGFDNVLYVYLDEPVKDEEGMTKKNIKYVFRGTDNTVSPKIKDMDLKTLLAEEDITDHLEENGVKHHFARDVHSGKIKAGRLIVLGQDPVSEFQARVADKAALYLGEHSTDYYRELDSLRQNCSKKNAQELMKNGYDFTPKKKPMSSFYIDIVGFTKISDMIPGDDVGKLLKILFTELRGIVDDNDAMLDNYLGDCIFGHTGPLQFKGDKESYAHATVNIMTQVRDKMGELNNLYFNNPEYLVNDGYSQKTIDALVNRAGLHLSMGCASGEAEFGKHGDGQRRQLTAIGDHVNVASRVQGIAKTDQVLIDQETFKLLTGKDSLCEGEEAHVGSHKIVYAGQHAFKSKDGTYPLYEVNRI